MNAPSCINEKPATESLGGGVVSAHKADPNDRSMEPERCPARI
jgi:hypothetical protein